MDWSLLATIGEAIAFSVSILGITGLGYWLAEKLLEKIAKG